MESKGNKVAEEADIIEEIQESDHVWKGNEDRHRWWNQYTYVVKINGMFIMYRDAETTGDMSASETGYEFSSDSICECEPKERTIIEYAPKV
jgi:hypothetical protein